MGGLFPCNCFSFSVEVEEPPKRLGRLWALFVLYPLDQSVDTSPLFTAKTACAVRAVRPRTDTPASKLYGLEEKTCILIGKVYSLEEKTCILTGIVYGPEERTCILTGTVYGLEEKTCILIGTAYGLEEKTCILIGTA